MLKAVGITLIFIALLTVSLPTVLAQDANPVHEAGRAEALIKVAEKAYTRIESLIKEVATNETLIGNVKAVGLSEAFNANVSLCTWAKNLIEQAKAKFQAGNYTEAVNLALQAMNALHKAFKGLNLISERIGIRAEPAKGQGLLVAVNRTRERIRSVEATLEAKSVGELLSQAEGLLVNVERSVQRGEVDEAAQSLAEANRLVAQAFSTLRSKAEEKMVGRVERLIEKFSQIHGEIVNEINRAGLNASRFLSGLGLEVFNKLKQDLIERVKGTRPEDIRGMMDELREIGRFLHGVRSQITAPPLVKVQVKDILDNPAAWTRETVVVVGRYYQSPPEGLSGPTESPPKALTSWIIADETGWIYVTVKGKTLTPFLRPAYEEEVTVVGVVEGDVNAPYITAKVVLTGPIKPIVSQPVKGALNVTVEKQRTPSGYALKVTVTNRGNDTVMFKNGALGISLRRMVNGAWRPFYTPTSIEVLVELKPGESRTITLWLKHPPKGVYEVTVSGWLEAKQPVTAEAVFTIP